MFCRQQWAGKARFLKGKKKKHNKKSCLSSSKALLKATDINRTLHWLYHLLHQNCSSFLELPNRHLGQPHLSAVVHFRAEHCDHTHACWSRRLCPLAEHRVAVTRWTSGKEVHPSGNLPWGIYVYSHIITNRNRRNQQREPEFKKKLLPLSNGSNLHQNYPSSMTLLQEFLDPFLSQLQRRSWAITGPKLCPLMATSQRSNSIKGTQITYFYSCNFW